MNRKGFLSFAVFMALAVYDVFGVEPCRFEFRPARITRSGVAVYTHPASQKESFYTTFPDSFYNYLNQIDQGTCEVDWKAAMKNFELLISHNYSLPSTSDTGKSFQDTYTPLIVEKINEARSRKKAQSK